MNEQKKVVLSLGSNMGDREVYLQQAMRFLKEKFQVNVQQSSLYETEPWGFETEHKFLNCCVLFESSKNANEILEITQRIERDIGRSKKSKEKNYQSREIDIDILYVGDLIIRQEKIVVPHPLLYERKFVLIPLLEICPNLIDPEKRKTIYQLNIKCNDECNVKLYKR